MSGRPKIKVFEYDAQGTHIKTFKDMSLCRQQHFSEIKGKIPILRFKRMDIDYGKTPEGTYIVKERLGRSKIRLLARLDQSIYCTDLIIKRNKPIQVFNLEGVLLLEARNLNTLCKLTNIPQGTISQQLSLGVLGTPKGEFLFKYKEEESDLGQLQSL